MIFNYKINVWVLIVNLKFTSSYKLNQIQLRLMIVITGSESFVGRELIKQLIKEKKEVIGIDLVNEKSQNYKYIKMDICSNHITDIIPNNTEAIIHLAALSSDLACRGKAYECFNINVMGTLNLMNTAMKKNVKQFIFASSEWVYNGFIYNEEKNEETIIDISKISSEYALSKIVSETNLRQQYALGFCDITILRYGIIYGKKNGNGSAVESIARKVKNGEKITIGSLKTGRRFVHVKDIIKGIILSLGLENFNIINLSGDKVNTLEEIIEASQRIFHKKIEVVETDPNNPNIRNPSNRKAKKIINWEPEIDLEQGIKDLESFL